VKTYTTKAGETWDMIAYKLWGNEFDMTQLQQANPDHLNVVVFNAGVVLNVPEIDLPEAEVLPLWLQKT
jgi:phage tail protein X